MQDIGAELRKHFGEEKLKLSLTDRYAFAGDAGFYYLLPQAIVQPADENDIRKLFLFAKEFSAPLVFRTGGTSLSGQSVTDGILVDLSPNWKTIVPLKEGAAVRVQPAAIGSHVNRRLFEYSKKIGPDPASISAAMMGGILSNNSSGMCCGVSQNSYHTLQSIRFILPNGHQYDTGFDDDYIRFQARDQALWEGIGQLRQRVLSDEALLAKIKSKYRIKNTVGYSINAFIDFSNPLDILAHLLIGAEGTLAFISEAVLKTVSDWQFKYTGLLFFDSPVAAANAIPALKATDAAALEFMDRPALASVEQMAYCPDIVKTLPPNATALLCEYQAGNPEGMEYRLQKALEVIDTLPLIGRLDFTRDEEKQAKLWKLRKGMYPSVAAVRASGTTAMLEDVAVPVENLGSCVTDLHLLFKKYGYDNAIIFGHAKEGNLHFLVTQPVNKAEEIAVFKAFNEELAALVIGKYNGSLKAEHGTGRQIAPFVKDEWGEEAYAIMEDLKKLVDPDNILNPGVIINHDPACHLKNMKTLPVVEEEVDKCVECGYCENRCPSRNFTLTPRQRIQIRRSIQRLRTEGNETDANTLQQEFQYAGMDTCAVDGMCATDCPVSINTGELIKRLRRENHSQRANRLAMLVSKTFGITERLVKLALNSGRVLNVLGGDKTMEKLTMRIRKKIPQFPLWKPSITHPLSISSRKPANPDLVYFPTCITRMMGADWKGETPIHEVLQDLCEKAKLKVFIASNTTGVCCGQLFSSKGFLPAYRDTVNKTINRLWKWTKQGKVPVLIDVTSCTHSLQTAYPYLNQVNQERYKQLQFIDMVDFAADFLLTRLKVQERKNTIVFHPVCTSYKMDQLPKLRAIGKACARKADIPFVSGCCGMAGDRGFYYPGLTANATSAEAAEVQIRTEENDCEGFYSSGKTCEMAMQEATGLNYQSVLYLIRDVTKEKYDLSFITTD